MSVQVHYRVQGGLEAVPQMGGACKGKGIFFDVVVSVTRWKNN